MVDMLIERVLFDENGLSHGHVDVLTRVVVWKDIDSIDHLKGIVEFRKLLTGWKIEE
jgi:hypothetical protein